MDRIAKIADGFVSLAIVVVSVAILYFAFQLVPAPIPLETKEASADLSQVHVGVVSGRTKLFTIDSVLVDGKEVPEIRGTRADFAVSDASHIVVTGWALDSRKREPVSRVVAAIGNDVTVGPVTIERPDVVAAFHLSPQSVRNGFRLDIPTHDLDPGRHRLHFLVITTGDGATLDTNLSLDFTKARGRSTFVPRRLAD